MARMLHRREAPAQGRKVFLAVTAYDGCGAGLTHSLHGYGIALERAGIAQELAIYSGNCHVDDSRNRLVRDFLASDCTDMVFLDADVGGPPQNIVDLVAYDRDVVAGVYPKRADVDAYPVKMFPGDIWSDADGLIEVQGVPAGFLRIRRTVLQRLAAEAVHYRAPNDADAPIPLVFERQVHDGTRWGGDYVFCRKWRAMGGRIYIAPEMRFEHSGEFTWTGSVGAWLRAKNGIGLVRGLKAFAEGRETPEDAVDLYEAWANPFAALPELLLGLAMVARATRGPILELGSGLSTLVLAAVAAGRPVHSIEQSPIFAAHVSGELDRHDLAAAVHCVPMVGGWYDPQHIPCHQWGLVIVDGPSRAKGERMAALDHLDLSRAVVVADDVDGVDALARTHDVRIIKGKDKSFAIAAPRETEAQAA